MWIYVHCRSNADRAMIGTFRGMETAVHMLSVVSYMLPTQNIAPSTASKMIGVLALCFKDLSVDVS